MALIKRCPVITIMGHVDHGKTTLLDYIRQSHVQASEAGGMTQHIGAYQIMFKNQPITFIDTPGHAAFNKMRQRGAQVTDLVVLVIAANDGVKPQTIESIRHIKEAKVPVMVAINKIDLPDVRPDNIKSQLAEHQILVQEYGGDVEVVEISAKTGKGVNKLLETIVLLTDLMELKADPQAPMEAIVIESTKDKNKGAVARVIVKQGTLQVRQELIAGEIKGKARCLINEKGELTKEVLPGSPIEIVGLAEVPEVGETVREIGVCYTCEPQNNLSHTGELEKTLISGGENVDWDKLDLDYILGKKEKIKLIIKADVKGTLEAILQSLDHDSVEVLRCGVGQITEEDLELASSDKVLLIAFSVKVPNSIKKIAKNMGVKIKEYEVIYHLIEDLQKQMLKLMDSTIDEVVSGEAEILQIFEMKGEQIAGIRVKTGEIKQHDLLHLKRGEEIVANPVIKKMMHGKDEIQVVKTKNEAGLTFKNKKIDFQVGDLIVAYRQEE